jgi:hypothetical protein
MSCGRPIRFCTGGSAPAPGVTVSGPPAPGGGTSMPIACIRARWDAAFVFAQGKSGPGAKYWTSSCMYLPEGKVMPAYSTWQPVVAVIPPITSAAQAARVRPRAGRGSDPM